MTEQTAQNTCWKALSISAPILKETYVRDVSMNSFLGVGIPFHNNFKYNHHDTAAMVMERNRLSGNYQLFKAYLSG